MDETGKAGEASEPVRFWGTVTAVRARLVVTKFAGDTTAKAMGYVVAINGTRNGEGGLFTVAVGQATQEKRTITRGDLLRGDAHPVSNSAKDTPADLYRVGVLRTIARGETLLPVASEPWTHAPLEPGQAEAAPRRALKPDNLEQGERCALCSYGTVVALVRLTDPRMYRQGHWSHVPACLGPESCPRYVAP